MPEPSDELPIWARPEAFPPADPGWGWVDRKGRRTGFDTFEELAASIIDDAGARVDLVWTPGSPNLVLPEEIEELHPALREARVRWALWEIEEGLRQMKIFGAFTVGLVLYSLYRKQPVLAFGPVGLALLLFLILGFIPWYQGRKRLARAKAWAERGGGIADIGELRFETWLMHQKAPVTRILFGMVSLVSLVQWIAPGNITRSLALAGLTKANGAPTDWWRVMTAAFMHGHWIHFLFNAMALVYLGRRMELLVRWPHVALVFLLSAWIGGEASSWLVDAPTLGASGGLLGMLGFLLVFEWRHSKLVPQSSRRRLTAGLLMTAVIGMIGYRFIDNAAHGGGLLAGMVYAWVVFPKSRSAHRPSETVVDRVAGGAALAVLVGFALFACWKLAGG